KLLAANPTLFARPQCARSTPHPTARNNLQAPELSSSLKQLSFYLQSHTVKTQLKKGVCAKLITISASSHPRKQTCSLQFKRTKIEQAHDLKPISRLHKFRCEIEPARCAKEGKRKKVKGKSEKKERV